MRYSSTRARFVQIGAERCRPLGDLHSKTLVPGEESSRIEAVSKYNLGGQVEVKSRIALS